jgi:hypothetical protein
LVGYDAEVVDVALDLVGNFGGFAEVVELDHGTDVISGLFVISTWVQVGECKPAFARRGTARQ